MLVQCCMFVCFGRYDPSQQGLQRKPLPAGLWNRCCSAFSGLQWFTGGESWLENPGWRELRADTGETHLLMVETTHSGNTRRLEVGGTVAFYWIFSFLDHTCQLLYYYTNI